MTAKTTYTKLISTHTVPGGVVATKMVLRPVDGETIKGRSKRLHAQSATAKSRIVKHNNNVYTVTSQQRDADGKPITTYDVVDMGDGLYLCQCAFGVHQPGAECAHIERVRAYQKRNGLTPKTAGPSISEQVTEQWIARSRAARAKRTEWEEEV